MRILAIDAFRGFTMILMISSGFGLLHLRGTPGIDPIAAQFTHADWIGMTAWDLIQPFFMFIVGAVMPWSFEKRLAEGTNPWPRVLKRSALLLFWGTLARSIRAGRPLLDVINVLGQLAFAYPVAFSVLRQPERVQLLVACGLLAVHTIAYVAYGSPWTVGANLGESIDRAVFGKNWGGHYATINCISSTANVIFGVVAGQMIKAGALRRLARFGGILLIAGLAVSPLIPVIKKIWTASFALVSGGITVLVLLLFWWLCEVKGWKMRVAVMVGANSIFIYLFHEIMHDWLLRTAKVFTGWGTAYSTPAMLVATDLAAIAFQIWLCVWLYRRNIFFRL